jgi:DNA-binding MarR family transcriptional regulator
MIKIDEAIRSRFRNDRQKAGINLIFTSNWFSDKISSLLKKFGITMQQYNILRITRGASPKPVTIKYIKERMLDKMSDVSRVVENLREKGLINRVECPEDRRNVNITLTDDGFNKLADIDTEIGLIDDIFSCLTDEEVILFNDILDKLRG